MKYVYTYEKSGDEWAVEIDYDVQQGGWREPFKGASLQYWQAPQIDVNDVQVLKICGPSVVVERAEINEYRLPSLDGEAFDAVTTAINDGPLFNELVRAAKR